MVVMGIITFFSAIVRSHTVLLIIGLMVGYLASSAISLLNFFSTAEGVKSYMVWGMGSFGNVSSQQVMFFIPLALIALAASLLLVKPLNAMLLGEQYAENLGFNIRRLRIVLLIITGLLTAVVTAFCGPIAFIGLATPHIARLIIGTENHRRLLPVTMLMGAAIALLCNLFCTLPSDGGIIPLNAEHCRSQCHFYYILHCLVSLIPFICFCRLEVHLHAHHERACTGIIVVSPYNARCQSAEVNFRIGALKACQRKYVVACSIDREIVHPVANLAESVCKRH
jgi:hypothetical protein